MYRFTKKPVEIEAFQMTKERRWNNSEWPNWLNKAWQKNYPDIGAVSSLKIQNELTSGDSDRLIISTLEGTHTVSWGDFIIQGIQGELYPCKPDIFEQTYVAVN